jgi:hypothetical protein
MSIRYTIRPARNNGIKHLSVPRQFAEIGEKNLIGRCRVRKVSYRLIFAMVCRMERKALQPDCVCDHDVV